MQENRERWMELVQSARNEQDLDRKLAIVREVDRLLVEEQKRRDNLRLPKSP